MSASTQYSLFALEQEVKEIKKKVDYQANVMYTHKKQLDHLRLKVRTTFEKGNPDRDCDNKTIEQLVIIIRKSTEELGKLYEPVSDIRLKLYNIVNIEKANLNLMIMDKSKISNKNSKKSYSDSEIKIQESIKKCYRIIKQIEEVNKSISGGLSVVKIDLSNEEKEMKNKYPINPLSKTSMETARRIEISYSGKKASEFIKDGKKSTIKCFVNANLGLPGFY